MLHILLSRKILLGFIVCLLFVAGSLVYQESLNRDIRKQEARTQRFLQQIEANKGTRTPLQTESIDTDIAEQTDAIVATDNVQGTVYEKTDALPIGDVKSVNTADAFLPDDTASEDEIAEVPVSPFGFGPYPEVPADFPSDVIWDNPRYQDFPEDVQRELELIKRVLIQLWEQGNKGFQGGSMENGKVYPYYHNTVYVQWREQEMADGTRHLYISTIMTSPRLGLTREQRKQIRLGNPPPHIRILDLDSTGIDPYQFLNLN